MTPAHDTIRADDDQRALGKATWVIDPEGAARLALGLEVRELLDAHPQPLAEGRLRVAGIARDSVQRRPLIGELRQNLLVEI